MKLKDVQPTYVGDGGAAWEFDLSLLRENRRIVPDRDTTVALWIVEASWAHPVWNDYALLCFHLRPLPGFPDAKILKKGATHEFHLFALDPTKELKHNDFPPYLTPQNFIAQLVMEDDEAAGQEIERLARDIADAVINPDTDFRSALVERYGDHMYRR